MATYELALNDGSKLKVQAPAGATQDEIIALANQQFNVQDIDRARRDAELDAELASLTPEYEEPADDGGLLDDITPDFLEETLKGTAAGAAGIVESAALGAATVLDEEAEVAVRDGIKSLFDPIQEALSVDEDTGGFARGARKFGEGLGSFGGILAASAINPFLGAGVAVSAGAGEASERARAADATEAQRGTASILGAGVGATELISPLRILSVFKKGLGENATAGLIGSLKRIAGEAGIEAAQEAAAGALQNLIERGYNPQGTRIDQAFAGTLEQGLVGGGVGGFVQGLLELAVRGRIKTNPDGSQEVLLLEDKRDPLQLQDQSSGPVIPAEQQGVAGLLPAPRQQLEDKSNENLLEDKRSERKKEIDSPVILGRDDTATDPAIMLGDKTPLGDPEQVILRQENITRQREQAAALEQQKAKTQRARDEQGEAAIAEATSAELRALVEANPDSPMAPAMRKAIGERDAERKAAEEQPTEQTQRLTASEPRSVTPLEPVTPTTIPPVEPIAEGPAVAFERPQEVVKAKAAPQATLNVPKEFSDETIRASQKTDDPITFGVQPQVEPEAKAKAKAEDIKNDTDFVKANSLKNNPLKAEELPKSPDDTPVYFATMKNEKGAKRSGAPTPPTEGGLLEVRYVGPREGATFGPEAVYDLVDAETGKPSSSELTAKQIIEYTEQDMIGGYFSKSKDKNDPNLKRWRNIDDEDIYTNRVYEDADPFRPLEFKDKPKTGTKFDPSKLSTKPLTPKAAVKKDEISSTVRAGEAIAAVKKEVAPAIAAQKAKKAVERDINREVTREQAAKAAPAAKQVADVVKEKNPNAEFLTKQDKTSRPDIKLAVDDVNKVADLVSKPQVGPQSKEAQKKSETVAKGQTARHAYTYFTQASQSIAETINIIAHDMVNASEINKASGATATSVEANYVRGTGRTNAIAARKWIKNNLSDKLNNDLDALIAKKQAELELSISRGDADLFADLDPKVASDLAKLKEKTPQELKAEADAQKLTQQDEIDAADRAAEFREEIRVRKPLSEEEIPTLEEVNDLTEALKADAVVGLDVPTHPVVGNLLRQGKLVEALRALQSTSPSGRVSQLAGALAKVTGDTKVRVKQFVTNVNGDPAAGIFDPATNTITLDAETGINPHTILHEMTHAATSATLANKSHPLTKQLTKLFNDVKGSLDTVYGSQNVDEFVAETFGNPEFQQKLAGINVKGEPINALQRFFNSVANVLRRAMGMQTKPADSALNQADKLIEAMLAPAPESRNAGKLFMGSNVIDMIKNTAARVKSPSTPKAKSEFIDKISDIINGGAAKSTKTQVMKFLPLQAITDLAKKYKLQKVAVEIQETVEKQIGDTNKADVRVDTTLKVLETWQKNNPTLTAKFNNVIYQSTTEGVDPTDTLETNPKTGKEFLLGADGNKETNPEKIAQWKVMTKKGGDWDSIGADGKATYVKMRNAYQLIYKDLRAVVDGQIDDLVTDADNKAELKQSIMQKVFEGKNIRPYFPLTRKGDVWLAYQALNTRTDPKTGESVTSTETVYESFGSVTARKRRVVELTNDDRVVGEPELYQNSKDINFSNAAPESFVRQTLEILEKSKPDSKASKEEKDAHAAQRQEIMELFIKTLPETSFAKSMQRRGGKDGKGELGFDRDAFEAFRSRAYDMSRQVQRLKYSNVLRKLESKLEEQWKALPASDRDAASNVKVELLERSSFARNPPDNNINRLAAQANRIAFLGTIGFNVSSAVVNASQIPLVMAPMLNGRYRSTLGIGASYRAVRGAIALIGSSGITRRISEIDPEAGNTQVYGTPSIDNYYENDANGDLVVRKDLKLSDEKRKRLERLTPLVKMAGDRGLLNRSLFYDTLGIDSAGRKRSAWDTANAWGAAAFHVQESLNRQTALISAFDLEMQRIEKNRKVNPSETKEARKARTFAEGQAAASEALRMAQEMNGGAALATTGRIAQQGVGRVAMMYKGYGVQMYYTLFKTGDKAIDNWRKNNKYTAEEARAAKEQFFGVLLSSSLLAGVQGMPFVGAALMLANLFLDDDEDDAETILRKHIGELAYKGPLNAITGTDVASRIGLSNLLYRDNPYNSDASDADKVLEVLGGPAWSVYGQFSRGLKDVISENGDFERGVESMLPAALRNFYKGVPGIGRYARDEGILTRRGDPIVDDVTTGGLVAQMIGFAPTEYTLAQEQNQAIKRIDRSVNQERTQLLRKLYIGLRMGDDVSDVYDRVFKFNTKHPTAALSADSIKRSMKQHMRTSVKMHNGVTLSPNMQAVLKDHVADYWGYDLLYD